MNEPEIAYAKASPFQRCDDKFPKGRSILVQSFRFIPLSPGKNASPLQSPYLIAHCDRADNDPDDKELNAWQRIEGLLEVIEPVSA